LSKTKSFRVNHMIQQKVAAPTRILYFKFLFTPSNQSVNKLCTLVGGVKLNEVTPSIAPCGFAHVLDLEHLLDSGGIYLTSVGSGSQLEQCDPAHGLPGSVAAFHGQEPHGPGQAPGVDDLGVGWSLQSTSQGPRLLPVGNLRLIRPCMMFQSMCAQAHTMNIAPRALHYKNCGDP
jgi:hypothetical protein